MDRGRIRKLSAVLDRVAPLPSGQRYVAEGLYGHTLPMEQRVQRVQEGRRRLAEEEHPQLVRREALEGGRAGLAAGAAGVGLAHAASGLWGRAIAHADKKRVDAAADAVFDAMTSEGFFRGMKPSGLADAHGAYIPEEVADILRANFQASTGVPFRPQSTLDFLAANAYPLEEEGRDYLFPRRHRPGSLGRDDLRAMGRAAANAQGSADRGVSTLINAARPHLRSDAGVHAPPGTPSYEAYERLTDINMKGGVHQFRNLGKKTGIPRWSAWLSTPLPGGERVLAGLERGLSRMPGGQTLGIPATFVARNAVTRGAGLVGLAGLLGAGASALRERSRRDEMLELAEQSEDATREELEQADLSTAAAMASRIRPDQPLDEVARRFNAQRARVNPRAVGDMVALLSGVPMDLLGGA